MSLINDALKRAKQAQEQAPPTPVPGPPFRPVEPARYARCGVGLVLPAVLALVALLALLLVWRLSRNDNSVRALQAGPPPVLAGAAPPAPERRTPALREPDNIAAPSQSAALREPRPEASPANSSPQPAPPAPANASAPAPAAAETVSTNAPVAAEVSAPKPPPLRLQAIICDPKRPSALISGKTLFIGDRIGAYRLVALNPESATLVSSDQTNVLTLP